MTSTKVALADIHRSLLAFAEGISEQPLALESIPLASISPEPAAPESTAPESIWPLTWKWMSELSPATIALPESIDHFDSNTTDHAVAHTSNRKLFRSLVLRHIGLQQLGADHWFTTHPNLPVASAFGDPKRPQLLIDLFDLCEEARVTALLRRQYPGAWSDLDQLHSWARSELGSSSHSHSHSHSHSQNHSLRQNQSSEAVHGLRQLALETNESHSSTTPAGRRLQRLRRSDATKHHSLSLALTIFNALTRQDKAESSKKQAATAADILDSLLEEDSPEDVPNQDELNPDELNHDNPDKTDPENTDPAENDAEAGEDQGLELGAAFPTGFEHSELGAGHAQPPPDDADAPLPRPASDEDGTKDEEPADGDQTARPTSKRQTTATPLETVNRTYLYDEWSYVDNATLHNWCRVIEERLEGDDHHFVLEARQRNASLARKLEAQLAQLRPRDLVRTHRVTDGDDLDLDAIVESVADRHAGQASDDRLYVRKDRARRDVAAAFLIDLSASTSSPIEPPEPEPLEDDPDYILYPALPLDDPALTLPTDTSRSILDVSKEAVALMCDALDRLGDDHAIYGFSGHGRDNAEFYVAKDFGQRTSSRTWSALSAMKPRQYTRMGPAIRHTANKLAVQSARTKLLIMISDGYPQDVDYGEDRSDREYGVHDTASALRDATNQGIDTFCITIDAAGHDYLKRMCPDGRYLVIDEIESLPAALAQSYFNLSASQPNHAL